MKPVNQATLRILVISDGRPGHFNQAKGVVKALETHWTIETVWIEGKLRNGLLRWVLTCWLNVTRGRLPWWPLSFAYRGFEKPEGVFDLVLSAGGNSLPANAWLARMLGTRNVFVGTLRRLRPRLFWRVLTYVPSEPSPPFVYWKTTPVPVVPEEVVSLGNAFRKRLELGAEERIWSLLVGGDGGGYTFGREDWAELIGFLQHSARNFGVRWALVTSRRTGIAAETMMREQLGDDVIAMASYFSDDQGKYYWECLGIGECLFTTEDSHMMITEAIHTGKPVVSLRPRQCQPDPTNLSFLRSYQEEGYLQRLSLGAPLKAAPSVEHTFVSPLQELGDLLTDALRSGRSHG